MSTAQLEIPSPAQLLAAAEANRLANPDGDRTEWEMAFHEAGHVVAEWLTTFGELPDYVLIDDEHTDGRAAAWTSSRTFIGVTEMWHWLSRAQVHRPGRRPSSEYRLPKTGAHVFTHSETVHASCWRATAQAVTIAAGDVAGEKAKGLDFDHESYAFRVCGYEDPQTGDDRQLAELVDAVRMFLKDPEEWAIARYKQADAILTANWEHVRNIAAALVAKRRLDRVDLDEILPFPAPCIGRAIAVLRDDRWRYVCPCSGDCCPLAHVPPAPKKK